MGIHKLLFYRLVSTSDTILMFYTLLSEYEKQETKDILPGGESNPGLPRDRRGYLPLYYRGHIIRCAYYLEMHSHM